jgi:hypothetical protein
MLVLMDLEREFLYYSLVAPLNSLSSLSQLNRNSQIVLSNLTHSLNLRLAEDILKPVTP